MLALTPLTMITTTTPPMPPNTPTTMMAAMAMAADVGADDNHDDHGHADLVACSLGSFSSLPPAWVGSAARMVGAPAVRGDIR